MFEIFIATLGLIGILSTLYIINKGFKDTDTLIEYRYEKNLQKQFKHSKVVCQYCRSDLVLDESGCCSGCGAPI